MAISTLELSFPRSFLVKVYQTRYSSPIIEYSASYISPSFAVKRCAVRTINNEHLSKHCQLQIPNESQPQSKEGMIVLELRKLAVDVSDTEIRINLHDIVDQPFRRDEEYGDDDGDTTTIDRINFALPYSCVSKIVRNRGGSIYRSEAWYMGQSGVVLPCMLNTSESLTENEEDRLVLVFEGLILSCDISPLTLKFTAASVDQSKKQSEAANVSVSLPLTISIHPPLQGISVPSVQPITSSLQSPAVSFPLTSDSLVSDVTLPSQANLLSSTVPLRSEPDMTDSHGGQMEMPNRALQSESDESYRSLVHIEEIIAKDFSPKEDDSEIQEVSTRTSNRDESPDLLGKIIEETILKDTDSDDSLEKIFSVNPFRKANMNNETNAVTGSQESDGNEPNEVTEESDKTDIHAQEAGAGSDSQPGIETGDSAHRNGDENHTSEQPNLSNIPDPGNDEQLQPHDAMSKDDGNRNDTPSDDGVNEDLPLTNNDEDTCGERSSKDTDTSAKVTGNGERTMELIDPETGLMKTVPIEDEDEAMPEWNPDEDKQNKEKEPDDDKSEDDTDDHSKKSADDCDLSSIIESIKKSLSEDQSQFTPSKSPHSEGSPSFKMPSDLIPPPGLSLGFPPVADGSSSVPADSFDPEWKNTFPWVYHDDENKAMFCRICIMAKKKNIFTTGSHYFCLNPMFTHTQSKDHLDAVASVREQSPDSLNGEGPEWQEMLQQCREHLRAMKKSPLNSFNYVWLKEFDWLTYDEVENKMYCKLCKKHDQASVFQRGTCKFIRKHVSQHRRSKGHIDAMSLETASTGNAGSSLAVGLDADSDVIFGMETDGSDSEPLRWNRITPSEDPSSTSSQSTPEKYNLNCLKSYQDLSFSSPNKVAPHMLPVVVLEDVSRSPNMKSGVFDCRHLSKDGINGAKKVKTFKLGGPTVFKSYKSEDLLKGSGEDQPIEVQKADNNIKTNKRKRKKSKEESQQKEPDVASDMPSLLPSVEMEDSRDVLDSSGPPKLAASHSSRRESNDEDSCPMERLDLTKELVQNVSSSFSSGLGEVAESEARGPDEVPNAMEFLVKFLLNPLAEKSQSSDTVDVTAWKPVVILKDIGNDASTLHREPSRIKQQSEFNGKRMNAKSKVEDLPRRVSRKRSASTESDVNMEARDGTLSKHSSRKRSAMAEKEMLNEKDRDEELPRSLSRKRSVSTDRDEELPRSLSRKRSVSTDSESISKKRTKTANLKSKDDMNESDDNVASSRSSSRRSARGKTLGKKQESENTENNEHEDDSISANNSEGKSVSYLKRKSAKENRRGRKPFQRNSDYESDSDDDLCKKSKSEDKSKTEKKRGSKPVRGSDDSDSDLELVDDTVKKPRPGLGHKSRKKKNECKDSEVASDYESGSKEHLNSSVEKSTRKGRSARENTSRRRQLREDSGTDRKSESSMNHKSVRETKSGCKLSRTHADSESDSREVLDDSGIMTETMMKRKTARDKKRKSKPPKADGDSESDTNGPFDDSGQDLDDSGMKSVTLIKPKSARDKKNGKKTSKEDSDNDSREDLDDSVRKPETAKSKCPRDKKSRSKPSVADSDIEDDSRDVLDDSGRKVELSKKHRSVKDKKLSKTDREETGDLDDLGRKLETAKSRTGRDKKSGNKPSNVESDKESVLEEVQDDSDIKTATAMKRKSARDRKSERKAPKAESDSESDSMEVVNYSSKKTDSVKKNKSVDKKSESKPSKPDSGSDCNEVEDDIVKNPESPMKEKSSRDKKRGTKAYKADSGSETELVDDSTKKHKSSKDRNRRKPFTADSESESAKKLKTASDQKSGSKPPTTDSDNGSDSDKVGDKSGENSECAKQNKSFKDKKRRSKVSEADSDSENDTNEIVNRSSKKSKSTKKHKSGGKASEENSGSESVAVHDSDKKARSIVNCKQKRDPSKASIDSDEENGDDCVEKNKKSAKDKMSSKTSKACSDNESDVNEPLDDTDVMDESSKKCKSVRDKESGKVDSESDSREILDDSGMKAETLRDIKRKKKNSKADSGSESDTNEPLDDSRKVLADSCTKAESSKKRKSARDKKSGDKPFVVISDSDSDSRENLDDSMTQKSARDTKVGSKPSRADSDSDDTVDDSSKKSISTLNHRSSKGKVPKGIKQSEVSESGSKGNVTGGKQKFISRDKRRKMTRDSNISDENSESDSVEPFVDTEKKSKKGAKKKPSKDSDIESDSMDLIHSGKASALTLGTKSARAHRLKSQPSTVDSDSEGDSMDFIAPMKSASPLGPKSVRDKKSKSKSSVVENISESDSVDVIAPKKSASPIGPKSVRDKKSKSKSSEIEKDDDSDSVDFIDSSGKSKSIPVNKTEKTGNKASKINIDCESDTVNLLDGLDLIDMMMCHVVLHRI